jgi:hypothetical protein
LKKIVFGYFNCFDVIQVDILAAEHAKKDKMTLSNGKLKHLDSKFVEIEKDNSFYGHSMSTLEKANRRVTRRYQGEMNEKG